MKSTMAMSFNQTEFEAISREAAPLDEWLPRAVSYLESQGAKHLGSGLGRTVYAIQNDLVIKLAGSQFGREQNQQEDFSYDRFQSLNLLLPVLKMADDGRWLISPRAKIASYQDIADWAKMPLDVVRMVLDGDELPPSVEPSSNVKKLAQFARKEDMVAADLLKPDSWGKWRGKLWLLDYGLSKDIARRMKKTLYRMAETWSIPCIPPETPEFLECPESPEYNDDRNAYYCRSTGEYASNGPIKDPVVVRVAARYKNKKRVKTQDGKEMIVYEYSERQIANRNREKAKKIQALSKNIANLRKQVFRDLTSEDPKKALVALAVGLMDETYERVGNDESAKEGHYGVTGWSKKHVSFGKGKATIKYVGKSGVEQEKTVRDSALLKALRKAYDDAKDGIFSPDSGKVSASDVNAYLRTFGVTAKDIRGFHANDVMRGMLQGVRKGGLPEDKKEREQKLKEEFKQALEATAEAVGHEPATLRGQYLVPGMAEAYLKDGTILTKLDKTAAYSGSTLEQVMAGLGMLMTQSIIVTNQFFNEAEIRKFLALRKSYHEQFAEACEDLAEALEAGTFGVLAQAAAKPLQQIGGIPASQAQRALRLATRTFRGLKRIQARDLPEGADIRLLRLIRMAERLDPLNEERSYKDYAVFLDQLIRVQEIPAPVRTLLRKALKYTQYARPDETANPGAWFEMSPETQNQFKALAEKLNQQTTEIFEQYQDPEERREKWQVNNRKLEKLRNAAGVNMDVVLQGAAGKETESIDKTLQKESKLQADGPTEYVLQQVHNVLYRSGEYAHKGEGKGVSREVRKVLTKLSKARKFDTIRRIIKEAVSQRLFGEDMTSTVDNILKGAGKNLAVQRGIPLTPLQWAPISEEDFQVKHNTGTVRFEEDLPKERREEVLGRVSRALEDLEGIFGKGFAGKHDKPLQFFFTGGGAFASASYFAYDNPATWQPRVKFGDDYEGLLAHELSHYFDDLLANKIAKIERPDAVPYMSRELFGLTGVKLDYLAGNEQWMERMRRTIPELAELAQTIVSTKDYARWKDMTSSAHEMAVGKAVQALTGQEVYDLPKDNPFAKVYWELPRYRSDWPPELLAETEKQYKAMMDGDDRKLTYYHSGVEIWARVIEQYIYTKLAKVGIANPWLTQLTYDTDVLPQAMEQETFEEKIVPILDRLFAKIKERQLIARIQARYVQAILRIPHV